MRGEETGVKDDGGALGAYALGLADGSYDWYRTAAIRSRRRHRISSIGSQVLAAAIPVSAAVSPHNAAIPAVFGAVIVVVAGLRNIFNWQENYIRFSGAREAVERERRMYNTGAAPYHDPATRDQILAAQVTSIEHEEMSAWFKIVSEVRREQGSAAEDPAADR